MFTGKSKSVLMSCAFSLVILAISVSPSQAEMNPSYDYYAPIDTVPFYPGASYDPSIPRPEEVLPNPIGTWPNRYEDIVRYIEKLASVSDRVMLVPHERTFEGRQLYNVIISTPANLGELSTYRDGMAQIADPSKLSGPDLDAAIKSQPAFAWLGYSIHGDEISGTDAASMLCYHLAAATDSATVHILQNVIVIIDPSENPDGRDRYLSMLQIYRSHVPNYNRRSAQHSGVWPWGRGNHYWFDLNRDWIVQRQPETRGRTKTILEYNPVTVVDAHEMGSNSTFLFVPPREPINYNTPPSIMKWYKKFSADQAKALDKRGWPYYNGEWNDQWFPGYGSSWSTFFGAIGILYEQAGVVGQLVRQQSDYILTYHESINHQFTSSLANLTTTADNREQLLKDYHNTRHDIAEQGRRSGLSYVFVPDDDQLKTKRFIESLIDQGITVEQAQAAFTVAEATSGYGTTEKSRSFPSGSYIVRTAQAEGALAKAVLDFDPHLKLDFLKEERRELEKFDETRMYEVSTWSLPLGWDMDAWQTTSAISVNAQPITKVTLPEGGLVNPDARFAFIVDMKGEKTFQTMVRLFKDRIVVYASEKPFTVEGHQFRRGALLIRKLGNPDDLATRLQAIADEVGIEIVGVNTGASSAGSDLGAETFHLLRQPRIAILTGSPLDYNSAGVNWFVVDRELGIPHSLLRVDELGYSDLSPYNVLVIPSAWGGSLQRSLTQSARSKLRDWVHSGGTLICMGSSAAWAADSATGLTSVKLKRQALEDLGDFDRWVGREERAEAPPVDTMALWHPEKAATPTAKEKEAGAKLSKDDLKDLDQWQRKFSPRGVILRANVDTEDWLAFGMKPQVPVIVYTDDAFLSDNSVKTTARFADENNLRLSGLLWPEARARWAKTAYAVHERSGQGQIVLFADNPDMRAYFYGTRKMLVNALLYGPGMGTRFDGPYQ